jgi:hypothetical protein
MDGWMIWRMSLSYKRRWLKVIAVVQKQTKLIEKISNTEFCIYVDSENSLRYFIALLTATSLNETIHLHLLPST